jgi:hypothetical protein
MRGYLIQLDLKSLALRASQILGCRLSVAEVREILCRAGSVECAGGWLMSDLRPLMMACLEPSGFHGEV